MEIDLEECIWGRIEWQDYVEKIITTGTVNEAALLERIEVVKSNVGRQIRKAIEQHHPRLVEQASALHGLDLVQATISREMSHLFATSQELSSRFASAFEKLTLEICAFEQLHALKRILYAAYRCEQLIRRLNAVNELVKQSEMICELESVISEFPQLKEITWLKGLVLTTAPKLAFETRQRTVKQLKASLESLNALLVASCVRALRNLSCYEVEVKGLLNEYSKELDAQFLQLIMSPDSAGKILHHISSQVQNYIEQLMLLGDETVSSFCTCFAQIITNRVPANAHYSCRILQLFTPIFSPLPLSSSEKVFDALCPLKTAFLSQSLNRMFAAVSTAFEDSSMRNAICEKISNVFRKELGCVGWDADLRTQVEGNVVKTMEFISQKAEALLKLDEESLLIGERVSNVQASNYSLLNVAFALCNAWPKYNSSLMHVVQQGRDAVIAIGKSSVSKILLSMHSEELGSPSPYAKELCEYLYSFRVHLSFFMPLARCNGALATFIDYVIDLFLIHASLFRPTSVIHLGKLANDLRLIFQSLEFFDTGTSLLSCVPAFADALCMTCENLANTKSLPCWVIIQLLISHSDSSLLSPNKAIDNSLQQYVGWFSTLLPSDRIKFLSSVIESYALSVVSQNCSEYVSTYPLIVDILKRGVEQ